MFFFFSFWHYSPNLGLGLPPRHSLFHFGLPDLRHLVGFLRQVIRSSQGLYLYTNTRKCTHSRARTHTHTHTPNIHALSGIQTHKPSFQVSEDSACLRPLSYCDWIGVWVTLCKYYTRYPGKFPD